MSLRSRVGRHARQGGRQCQNWIEDQQTIIGLLNLIGSDQGGAAGSIPTAVRAGICGDTLYAAILRFEDKHFPGQRTGFVEPGGAMLKRMETLAGGGTVFEVRIGQAVLEDSTSGNGVEIGDAVLETPLDTLRWNVEKIASVVERFRGGNAWTAGDRVQLDSLVKLAVRHIDNLKKLKDAAGNPVTVLPWWGEVFGRVLVDFNLNRSYGNQGDDIVVAAEASGKRTLYRTQMWYGGPLARDTNVTTAALPGLLLFSDGVCYPLRSRFTRRTREAHDDAADAFAEY